MGAQGETATWFAVISFNVNYMPWVLLLVSFMLYNNPIINLMGIVAGYSTPRASPSSLDRACDSQLMVVGGARDTRASVLLGSVRRGGRDVVVWDTAGEYGHSVLDLHRCFSSWARHGSPQTLRCVS